MYYLISYTNKAIKKTKGQILPIICPTGKNKTQMLSKSGRDKLKAILTLVNYTK